MAESPTPTGANFQKLAVTLVILLLATAGGYLYLTEIEGPTAPTPGVVLFRHSERSESTEQRAQGFLDTMEKEYPDVPVIASVQYLGTTQASSVRQSRAILEQFGNAVRGIFCVNEPNAVGCLQTLEEMELAGTIPYIGFDTNATLVAALEQGKMAGLIVQDPVDIGYQAVNAALKHLAQEEVEKRITTDFHVATSENLESDELRPLLYPERFSGVRFEPETVEFTIGVVTKGLTHEYWQFVRAGAEKAAEESGMTKIRFEAPVLEQDVDGQIEVVRQLIADKVSAVCLAPIDNAKLGDVILEAQVAGVPVVIFDSGLDAESVPEAAAAIVSYVATDNYEAGATAARRLVEAMVESNESD